VDVIEFAIKVCVTSALVEDWGRSAISFASITEHLRESARSPTVSESEKAWTTFPTVKPESVNRLLQSILGRRPEEYVSRPNSPVIGSESGSFAALAAALSDR